MARAKQITAELLAIGGITLVIGLVANALSARGLQLTRNYFPASAGGVTNLPPAPPSLEALLAAPTNQKLPPDVAARLQKHGLRGITSEQALALFQDPRYQQGQIVFIDARDDFPYLQLGHVPGAWQFHHYRAEKFLDTVVPVCQAADLVVVYCTGGDCEDSEFASLVLRDAGVAAEKLLVYVGGINEWTAAKYPVETGVRNSGTLRPTQP